METSIERFADDLRAAGFDVLCPVAVPSKLPALMIRASVLEVNLPVLNLRGEFNEFALAVIAKRLAVEVAELIA